MTGVMKLGSAARTTDKTPALGTAGQYLDRAAQEAGDLPALTFADQTLSYRELAAKVDALAVSLIELGIKHGDRAVILMPNWHQFIVASQAVLKIGAIKIPLPIDVTPSEIAGALKQSGAKAIIMISEWNGLSLARELDNMRSKLPNLKFVMVVGQTFADMIPLRQLVRHTLPGQEVFERYFRDNPVKPDDLACITYSRGTESIRSVLYTHKSIYGFASACNNLGKVGEEDIWLDILPLASSLGLQYVEPCPVMSNSSAVLLESFEPAQALSLIEKHQVTALVAVPSVISDLLESNQLKEFDLSSLRKVFLAGSVHAKELTRRIRENIGGDVITLDAPGKMQKF